MKNRTKKEDVALFIQVLLVACLLILSIMSFFIPELLLVVELVMACLMFDLAYNNYLIYHRPWMTLIYSLTGCLILGMVVVVTFFG